MSTLEGDTIDAPSNRSTLLFVMVYLPALVLVLGLAVLAWSANGPMNELSWPIIGVILVGLVLALGANLVLLGRYARANCLLCDTLQKEADYQELLRAVFDHAADGIITSDESGRIRAANKAAVGMFGFSPDEIIGQPMAQLLGFEGQPTGMEALKTNENRILGQMIELDALRKDGSRFPATVGVSKIRRGGRAFFTAIVRDQTVARDARWLAESASRAKSSFLVNMSHEFRTPLSAILGLADLLRGTTLAEQQPHLDHLTQSAEKLLAMVEKVLDFAHLEAGEVKLAREPFSLRQLVEEAVARSLNQARSAGLPLTVQIDAKMPDVFLGDPRRLQQILAHLIDNAVKFTSHGEVVVQVSEEDSVRSRKSSATPILIEVRDTGVGIPRQKVEGIFASFEQVDSSSTRRQGGVGLGLSIVSRLARLMGAQVTVESIESQGTTFRVRLPLPSAEDSFTPTRRARLPALVVLSDLQHASRIAELLRSWGWPVHHVCTGREALVELYRGVIQGKPYPVLLVEHKLADIALEEILAQQRRFAPNGFTLILGDPVPVDDWPVGVHAVLSPQCDADQLLHALERFDPSSPIELAG